LRATTIELRCGDVLALLGPNGSGKTTLLKILAGAISPTLGGGAIFGHDLARQRVELRPMVGYLSGDTYLYDDLTAAENLRFFATMTGLAVGRDTVQRALSTVDLSRAAGDRVRTFSSGMKRRLSLARLLLLDPPLLLLDEPYNSLDAEGANLIDQLVLNRAERGHVIVLATHDAERALALATSVAVLERGALTFFGPAETWLARGVRYVG
jgi:heme ABC exporter ATP-binding subunit CcmA